MRIIMSMSGLGLVFLLPLLFLGCALSTSWATCDNCGDDVDSEAQHWSTCDECGGAGYYTCDASAAASHEHTKCSGCGSEVEHADEHKTSCPEGHIYHSCNHAESDNHSDCIESPKAY